MQTKDFNPQQASVALLKPACGAEKLSGIWHIIAIGSGKGRVSKSTESVNVVLA
jgi:Mrp family chromosome partitioning ATPase